MYEIVPWFRRSGFGRHPLKLAGTLCIPRAFLFRYRWNFSMQGVHRTRESLRCTWLMITRYSMLDGSTGNVSHTQTIVGPADAKRTLEQGGPVRAMSQPGTDSQHSDRRHLFEREVE